MDLLQFTVQQSVIRMSALERPGAEDPAPAMLLLHGAGGDLDFWTARLAPYLEAAGISLYAPHYFDRTGTVRADHAAIASRSNTMAWLETVRKGLDFVAQRPGVDRSRIVLAGVSLGAFLSLALAAQLSAEVGNSDRTDVRAVIDVSGGLVAPFDTLATKRFPPTLILHGAGDAIVPASYAFELDNRLTELDVAHRTEILPGEGHWFSSKALPRMLSALSAFLEEHLRDHSPAQSPM